MPIKVFWNEGGPFALCDSPAEAAELLSLSGRADSQGPKGTSPELVPLTEERAMERFLADLKPNQKTFLAALVGKHPDGTTADQIQQEIAARPKQLGAILGSLSKTAKRNDLKITQLVLSQTRFDGPRRFRFLQAKPLIMQYRGKIAQEDLKLSEGFKVEMGN